MTTQQIYHYLLSFDEETLIKWYNDYLVDPYGDFREQIILRNNKEGQDYIKNAYDLEVLCEVMNNPKTRICEDDNYIMIDGADRPFITTFNTMEVWLANREYILTYIKEDAPELLDELKRGEK